MYSPGTTRILSRLIGANMNVTTDQAFNGLPALYTIDYILITNASISLTTCAGGFYTAATKGGTAIVAAAQVYSALTTAAKILKATIAVTDKRTEATLYLNLTTAQGAAATADVYIVGTPLTE